MKYKTLFRLMLKLLGVYFVVYGAPTTARYIGMIAGTIFDPGPVGMRLTPIWQIILDAMLAGALYPAIGLYLFFGGRWIADRAIPGNRPYCHECGYELSQLAGHICPECGTAFRPAAATAEPKT